MKPTLLLIAVLLIVSACSTTNKGFYEARLRYATPDSTHVVPAVVYVKDGKVKSIIVER